MDQVQLRPGRRAGHGPRPLGARHLLLHHLPGRGVPGLVGEQRLPEHGGRAGAAVGADARGRVLWAAEWDVDVRYIYVLDPLPLSVSIRFYVCWRSVLVL